MNPTKKYTPATILLLATIIITIILAFFAIKLNQDLSEAKKDYRIGATLDDYRLSKLEFCYQNNVKPCDDATIQAWNTNNPSTTFTIKDFKQLTDEGIKLDSETRR